MQTKMSKRGSAIQAMHALMILVIMHLTSCAWLEEIKRTMYITQERLSRVEQEQLNHKKSQEQINASVAHSVSIALGKLFCTDPRVQTFLRACNSHDPSAGCSDKMRESILTFMASQRHVVVYLGEGRGRKEIIPARKGMIQQLLKETRLLSTEFWIFANPSSTRVADVQEAEQRSNEVVEFLKETSNEMQNEIIQRMPKGTKGALEEEPAELIELRNLRIHSPQVFKMRLSGSDIEPVLRRNNQIDRPIGREPRDLGKGIWVFRTDCNGRS